MQARIIGANNDGVVPLASDFEQLAGQIGSYVVIKRSNISILAILTEAVLETPGTSPLIDTGVLPESGRRQIVSMIPLGGIQ